MSVSNHLVFLEPSVNTDDYGAVPESFFLSDCLLVPDVPEQPARYPVFPVWKFKSRLFSSQFVTSYLIFLQHPVEFHVCQFIPDIPVAAC
jgi:hypothetical protein